jgi:hypothetical protein
MSVNTKPVGIRADEGGDAYLKTKWPRIAIR